VPEPQSPPSLPDRQTPATVLCVDDDPAMLELVGQTLDAADGLTRETFTDPEAVLDELQEADCVVSDHEMPSTTGLELLAEVRSRNQRLPFLLLTGHDDPALISQVLDYTATEYLSKSKFATTTTLLLRRVRTLLAAHRNKAFAGRALAALDAVQYGVAIVTPDGTIAYADRSFEFWFGFDDGDLAGRSWRELFKANELDRFERSRGDTIEDGWRWSGECLVSGPDGATFTVDTTVSELADGSRVFVVSTDDSTFSAD